MLERISKQFLASGSPSAAESMRGEEASQVTDQCDTSSAYLFTLAQNVNRMQNWKGSSVLNGRP